MARKVRRGLLWAALMLALCCHFWDVDCLMASDPDCCTVATTCSDDCSLSSGQARDLSPPVEIPALLGVAWTTSEQVPVIQVPIPPEDTQRPPPQTQAPPPLRRGPPV